MFFDILVGKNGWLFRVWCSKCSEERGLGKLVGFTNTIDNLSGLGMVKAVSFGTITNDGAIFAMK